MKIIPSRCHSRSCQCWHNGNSCWGVQLFIMQPSYEKNPDGPPALEWAPLSPHQQPHFTHPLHSILMEHCKKYISPGEVSVFDSVQQLQVLALTLAYSQPCSATTCWNKDHNIVQFEKYQVRISTLTSGVRMEVDDLLEIQRGQWITGGVFTLTSLLAFPTVVDWRLAWYLGFEELGLKLGQFRLLETSKWKVIQTSRFWGSWRSIWHEGVLRVCERQVNIRSIWFSQNLGVGPHPGSNFVADCPSGVLHTFAPILFNFSQSTLDLLEVMNPDVRCYILDHPLASTTFNFGPRTITFSHKDLKNLSWRLCTVINLGSYDPMKGRHFVLWDLGITVEFFPYSTPPPLSSYPSQQHSHWEWQNKDDHHTV